MERPRPVILLALSLLAVIAASAPAVQGPFMWDDHVLIEENPRAHSLAEPAAFFTRSFWSHPFLGHQQNVHTFYRPLVGLSYALDWVRSDGSPAAFHMTNLLLHLVVVALVFALARRRGASGRTAALVAALFGLAPRLTESVAWISGRTDVLATVFLLLAVLVELGGPTTMRRRLGVSALLLAGLFSKEVTVAAAVAVTIAVLSALRVLRRSSSWRTEALLMAPVVGAVAVYALFRRAASDVATPLALSPPSLMLRALGRYTFMVVAPWFPNPQPGFLYDAEPLFLALGAVTLLAAAAGLWALWRARQDVPLALGLGAATPLVLVVVQLQLVGFAVAADRFLYVPLALGLVALSPALDRWRPKLVHAAALGLALTLVPATYVQAKLWTQELRFWQRAVEVGSPKNPRLWGALGDALFTVDRLEEALENFERASALTPSAADKTHRLSVSVTRSRLGRDAEAIAEVDRLARDAPGWRRAVFNRATFRSRALDFEGARLALEEARRTVGDDPVLAQLKDFFDETEAKVRALGPETAADPPGRALAWAELYETLGATGKARARYQRVAGDASASAEQRRAALSYLVIKGEPDVATGALGMLRALGVTDAQTLDGLAAILAERMGTVR